MEDGQMNREELKEMLLIKDDRTIQNYIEEGLIPFTWGQEEIIFEKEKILKILGVNQGIKEPFIDSHELSKILNVPLKAVPGYAKRKHLPCYTLKNSKGSKKYFLRSEIKSALDYKIEEVSHFLNIVSRNHFLKETMKIIFQSSFIEGLKDADYKILEDVLYNNASIDGICTKYNITRQRASQKIMDATRHAYYAVVQLQEKIGKMKDLETENGKYKSQNEFLLNKLKEYKEFNENSIDVQSLKMSDFQLSIRACNCLKAAEIKVLGELASYTRKDILKFRNMGEGTAQEFDRLLSKYGLSWKKEREKIKV